MQFLIEMNVLHERNVHVGKNVAEICAINKNNEITSNKYLICILIPICSRNTTIFAKQRKT